MMAPELAVVDDSVRAALSSTHRRHFSRAVAYDVVNQRPAVRETLRLAMEKRRITPDSIAKRLAKAIKCLDAEPIQERQFGLTALKLACRLRGDLVPAGAAGTGDSLPQTSLLMIVQVLRELKGEATAVDVTPEGKEDQDVSES
jgi:hypothetical protein